MRSLFVVFGVVAPLTLARAADADDLTLTIKDHKFTPRKSRFRPTSG